MIVPTSVLFPGTYTGKEKDVGAMLVKTVNFLSLRKRPSVVYTIATE
jgi:hypothetical protein